MAAEHGIIRSPVSNAGSDGPWCGRFSIVTATGANVSGINDASFTSRVFRESNHIIVTPANSTARGLNVVSTTAFGTKASMPYATMTAANASILLFYTGPALGSGGVARFYFQVFAGGTNT